MYYIKKSVSNTVTYVYEINFQYAIRKLMLDIFDFTTYVVLYICSIIDFTTYLFYSVCIKVEKT